MTDKEKLRLDKYLWAIRLYKTRRLAVEAIDKGRVKLNGDSVKASRAVVIGDEYEVKTEARRWRIKLPDYWITVYSIQKPSSFMKILHRLRR
jgi:ribosome-associated heat shock protein Hsp15